MQAFSDIAKTNVNNVLKTRKNNVNNVIEKGHRKTITEVRATASYLVQKLDDQRSYKFFCKVAWQLPEAMIMGFLEASEKGRSPKRLFTHLCLEELSKR